MNTDLHNVEDARDRAGSLNELLRVALPLVISYSATALMHVVDRIFLSQYSVEAMAASLPAGVLHWNLAALTIGTVTYANAIIGQYVGARQESRVGPVLWQAIYLSLIGAALMMGTVSLAPSVFAWIGHHPSVQPLEVRYYTILNIGSAPLLIAQTLACFYSGRGRTTTIMVVNILGTFVNIGLDYLLIFGNFGFPRLGIDGAALATAISFTAIALMYVVHMVVTQRHTPYRLWSGRHFDRELFGRLIRFGLPSGVQQFLEIGCWSIFIQLVGRLGKNELSATGLAFNLNSLAFIPMIGLGIGVTALVGQRIGEARPQLAVRTTWLAFGVGASYTAVLASVYLFAPHIILKPYGIAASQPEVEELMFFLLKLMAVYSIFDATAVIFCAAIRGAGDTRFAMVLSVGLGVLFLVIPTYVAAQYGREGFIYAWYAVAVFLFSQAVGFLARFQQGKWQTMRVIEHTAPELASEEAAEHSDDVAALDIAAP
jgi:MATE family multidrug resistance protein